MVMECVLLQPWLSEVSIPSNHLQLFFGAVIEVDF